MTSTRNVALSVALLVLSLLAWEAAVRISQVPAFILPPPSQVLVALYRGIASGLYAKHLQVTLVETILGFIVGATLGFVLGTAVAMNRYVEYFLYPYIVMFQSLPKVALAPLIVIWFGLGLTSKVINAALVAFFPLLVNTMVGLRSADEDRVSLMRSLSASNTQICWMLRLPNALPFVMAGLDIAMILALIGAIVAEFTGATAGLGMLILSAVLAVVTIPIHFAVLVPLCQQCRVSSRRGRVIVGANDPRRNPPAGNVVGPSVGFGFLPRTTGPTCFSRSAIFSPRPRSRDPTMSWCASAGPASVRPTCTRSMA
jgi:NitT/TauT family transport system permease protein